MFWRAKDKPTREGCTPPRVMGNGSRDELLWHLDYVSTITGTVLKVGLTAIRRGPQLKEGPATQTMTRRGTTMPGLHGIYPELGLSGENL